jgi:hypothetical protein
MTVQSKTLSFMASHHVGGAGAMNSLGGDYKKRAARQVPHRPACGDKHQFKPLRRLPNA